MGKGKRGRPSKKEQKTITNDMLGGFLVVFGLILAVFIGFRNIGSFAQICKVIFLGALGNSAYTFPFLLMAVGTYCIMSEEKVKPLNEIRKGLVVIALIAATLTVFTESSINLFSNPVKGVVDSVNAGIAKQNYGGAIGTLIGGVLSGIVGIIPARIILVLMTFMISLFIYNISTYKANLEKIIEDEGILKGQNDDESKALDKLNELKQSLKFEIDSITAEIENIQNSGALNIQEKEKLNSRN